MSCFLFWKMLSYPDHAKFFCPSHNSFKTFFEAYSFHMNYSFFSKARNESLHDLTFHLYLKINGTVTRALCIYEFGERSFLRDVCIVLFSVNWKLPFLSDLTFKSSNIFIFRSERRFLFWSLLQKVICFEFVGVARMPSDTKSLTMFILLFYGKEARTHSFVYISLCFRNIGLQ